MGNFLTKLGKLFANDRVKKIRNVIIIGLIAYVIAFFVDQYYFLGKKWWFILELI